MALISKRKVLDGVYLVEIPEVELKILCGCAADSIKHLALKGLIPIVEKNGVKYEAGPNAILLSDSLEQNGSLSNLSEFPVLHMFYNQGMIFPNHPNYSLNPILIGRKKQVQAQMDYIFLGNYGLVTEEEFTEAGESLDFAKENIRLKLKFALGQFTPTNKLMEGVFLEDEPVQLSQGVTINRLEKNVFHIEYKGKSVKINLNLKKYQKYKAPYQLPKIKLQDNYFAIVHSGEGDGWDPTRPCLSSIILFDKKIFLVDAGSNILETLKAFNIKPHQVEGVFITHVHDDHFAGLYSLINGKSKVKIIATSVIRSTVFKKMAALLSLSEKKIDKYFSYHEVKRDQWNNYQGLEIKPIPTAHPIDTTLFSFRVMGKNGYRSYGHFSDITAVKWLKKMVTDHPEEIGISEEYLASIEKTFKMEFDLKKIDVGGLPVHGDAEDFAGDTSKRLVMGHTHAPFTPRQLEIGEQVKFGDIDVLIDKKP